MTASADPKPGFTALDRAHELRLSADREGAARLSASILADNPDDLGAALLLARILVDADRVAVAGSVTELLVDAYARRADLPSAVTAAQLGAEAGGFADGAMRTLAKTFGKGSPQRGAGSMQPPPFPTATTVAARFLSLSGDELLEACEAALTDFLRAQQKKPAPPPAKVPVLPLFGELSEDALVGLLGSCEVRDFATGTAVVSEGDDAEEAFVVVRGLLNVVRGGDKLLAALGPGAIFGEMALLSDAPRAASVVAVEPTTTLVLSRTVLERVAKKEPALGKELGAFCHRRMISNLMRHSPVLGAVDKPARAELMKRFTPKSYRAGEHLLTAGQENARLAIVASGMVEVRGTDSDGDQVTVAQLGPGDVVGEISLVLRRPASADVVALRNTVALELSAEAFQEAIKAHPELLRELYELSVKRDDETRTVLAQQAEDVTDVILL